LPRLQKLIEQYKDRTDVLFLSLNMDDNPGLIDPFMDAACQNLSNNLRLVSSPPSFGLFFLKYAGWAVFVECAFFAISAHTVLSIYSAICEAAGAAIYGGLLELVFAFATAKNVHHRLCVRLRSNGQSGPEPTMVFHGVAWADMVEVYRWILYPVATTRPSIA
jgi:hypothetical protein